VSASISSILARELSLLPVIAVAVEVEIRKTAPTTARIGKSNIAAITGAAGDNVAAVDTI
jgi:hypothetical protein